MSYVWQKWLADELRAEGCRVKEYDGWKSRGRPASSGSFDPYALLLHHTGTKTSMQNPAPTLSTCVHGRSDLPGPLCQVLIGYDGTCHVIAAGRANHGGECNGNGPTSQGDANAQMIGFELDYSGSQPVSDEQADATARASVAVLRHFQKDQAYCRGHKETSTTGKWDPGEKGSGNPAYDMDEVRQRIKERLEGDDLPYSEAELKNMMRLAVQAELGDENVGQLSDRIADKVWSEVLAFHGGQPDEVKQKAGTGWLVYTERRVEALQAELADVHSTVDAIAAALDVAPAADAAGAHRVIPEP